MFHEVRILTPKGELKKIISAKELSKSYWNAFNGIQTSKLESLVLLREHKKQIKSTDYHAGGDTKT